MNLLDQLRHVFKRPLMCEDVNHFLALYLEGALDPKTHARFEGHVQRCPNCNTFLDQYRQTVELVREDEIADPPPELIELTLAFLRKHLENGQNDAG